MLHCIHFALSSPTRLEGGTQEARTVGTVGSVSSRVDEPASHEQQLAKTHRPGRPDLVCGSR